MRLDSELVATVAQLGGFKTKTAAVHAAIEEYIAKGRSLAVEEKLCCRRKRRKGAVRCNS